MRSPFSLAVEAGQPFLPVSSGRPSSRANSASISSTEKGSATFSAGFGAAGQAAGLPAGAGAGSTGWRSRSPSSASTRTEWSSSIVLLAVSHRRRSLTAMIRHGFQQIVVISSLVEIRIVLDGRGGNLARSSLGESGRRGPLEGFLELLCHVRQNRRVRRCPLGRCFIHRRAQARREGRRSWRRDRGRRHGRRGDRRCSRRRHRALGATGTSAACSSGAAQAGPRGPGSGLGSSAAGAGSTLDVVRPEERGSGRGGFRRRPPGAASAPLVVGLVGRALA